jgi:chorismate dehydratase
VKTGDSSFTLHSKEYDEAYHSLSGAVKEAFVKFSTPCRIKELAAAGLVTILDIGFGLGYNMFSAIYTARKANQSCEIDIVSLEKDLVSAGVLDSLPVLKRYESCYGIVKTAAEGSHYDEDGIRINVLSGDARQAIQTLDMEFDAVFLDPFSVKKNPELWTVEFFAEIRKRMKDTAILATYSAATPVRCGLAEAGFIIGPGPGDAMKKGGTLATKRADIAGFSKKDILRLENSPERVPFYDPGLNSAKEDIFSRRNSMLSGLKSDKI